MADLEGKMNPWKEAVINACVVNHISWDESDPRKTISDLIAYENVIALDPKVSEDAAKLVALGRAEGLEDAAKVCEDWSIANIKAESGGTLVNLAHRPKLAEAIRALLLGLTAIVLGLLFAVLAVTSLPFWEIIGVVVLLDASWLVGDILISHWRDWRKKCA